MGDERTEPPTFKQMAFLKRHWEHVTDEGKEFLEDNPTKDAASMIITAVLQMFDEEKQRRKLEKNSGQLEWELGE